MSSPHLKPGRPARIMLDIVRHIRPDSNKVKRIMNRINARIKYLEDKEKLRPMIDDLGIDFDKLMSEAVEEPKGRQRFWQY